MKKVNKNKSFVEIKGKNNNENIINPLDKYKYIEPKKKVNKKYIFLIILSIILILLIIILLKIIDNKFNKEKTEENETINMTSTINTKTESKNEENNITETLVCETSKTENNIEIDTIITAKFYNKKLREDSNKIIVKLLDENSKSSYNQYISILKMISLYLVENSSYDINYIDESNEFTLEIITTYEKDKEIDSNLEYDEDYESVKQKLIEIGNNCN